MNSDERLAEVARVFAGMRYSHLETADEKEIVQILINSEFLLVEKDYLIYDFQEIPKCW